MTENGRFNGALRQDNDCILWSFPCKIDLVLISLTEGVEENIVTISVVATYQAQEIELIYPPKDATHNMQ